MKNFITYLIRWVSSNLATPFWVVGHIHLSLNVYKDLYEILTSFGLNIIVGIGVCAYTLCALTLTHTHTQKYMYL